jgi:hypothetical protein
MMSRLYKLDVKVRDVMDNFELTFPARLESKNIGSAKTTRYTPYIAPLKSD